MAKLLVDSRKRFSICKDKNEMLEVDITAYVYLISPDKNKFFEFGVAFFINTNEYELKKTLEDTLEKIRSGNCKAHIDVYDNYTFIDPKNLETVDENEALEFAMKRLKELLNELSLEIEQKIKEL